MSQFILILSFIENTRNYFLLLAFLISSSLVYLFTNLRNRISAVCNFCVCIRFHFPAHERPSFGIIYISFRDFFFKRSPSSALQVLEFLYFNFCISFLQECYAIIRISEVTGLFQNFVFDWNFFFRSGYFVSNPISTKSYYSEWENSPPSMSCIQPTQLRTKYSRNVLTFLASCETDRTHSEDQASICFKTEISRK